MIARRPAPRIHNGGKTMPAPTANSKVVSSEQPQCQPFSPAKAPVQTLLEIARRYGTPTYAYDLGRVQSQVARLRANLPPAIEILYSLKANASLGLCGFIAGCGLGADAASAGELLTAVEAGFPPERIFVSGPDVSSAMLVQLRSVPAAILSIDSLNGLRTLAAKGQPRRALLRLRPSFCSFAACAAGPDSRFGLLMEELSQCREHLASPGVQVVGFHIFSGSQVLDAAGVIHHLRGALEQSLRAADMLRLAPDLINLGGGFGIPYGPGDSELDLAAVSEALWSLLDRAAPARLVLELGRYVVAQAGWYLTTVIAHQTHQGRPALVVDGGTHQRADLCGLGLRCKGAPPVALSPRPSPPAATDVLGCLSLPADVLVEAAALPPLSPGDVLAFPNAGAYGLTASPLLFHGHPAPAEVAFAEMEMEQIRARQPVRSLMEGQNRLRQIRTAADSSG
jgi:diaminopimelate decarboxylase